MVKYHAEHGKEFRLRCMIGAAKGYARLAKTEEEKQKHLETAAKLQHELDKEKTMDTRDVEALRELLEFERRMLNARITMEGMIAENKQRTIEQKSMAYDDVAFNDLINQFHIGFNDFPYYHG